MQAATQSEPQHVNGAWLRDPETRAVMAALRADGATPRFVGGCVRDALLGRAVRDIDIAVDRTPETVLAALKSASIRAIPTGLEHGTVTAVVNAHSFEVTSLREDTATDGRRAVVAYTRDWVRDAKRRDFTMNALYADADGSLFDVLGTGVRDTLAHRVRFIGSAVDRIHEDYLRILRLFRFHAWYGEGEMEPDALVAAAGLAGGLAQLSRERIGQEMLKLLAAPRPASALVSMIQTGVLKQALPHAISPPPVLALEELERRFGISPDPLRRLACLTWGQDTALSARALRLSNQRAAALKARMPVDYEISTVEGARRLGYERGAEAGRDVLLLTAAARGETPRVRMARIVTDGAEFALPVTAPDILALGISPGPEIGEALRRAEVKWIASDFTLDKGTLLDEVTRGMPRQ